jgi:hypothetical protein
MSTLVICLKVMFFFLGLMATATTIDGTIINIRMTFQRIPGFEKIKSIIPYGWGILAVIHWTIFYALNVIY